MSTVSPTHPKHPNKNSDHDVGALVNQWVDFCLAQIYYQQNHKNKSKNEKRRKNLQE